MVYVGIRSSQTLSLLYTGSFTPPLSPQGSLDVITAPHCPSLSQNRLCSAWASFRIPSSPPHIWSTAGGGHELGVSIISSVSTGCKVEAGESRIWNGEIIFRATDQCEPLSSCTPYFSRRRETSLLAHMLPATPIYQGVRAAMLHSLRAAGRGQTQQEVLVWKDVWLHQRWRDG